LEEKKRNNILQFEMKEPVISGLFYTLHPSKSRRFRRKTSPLSTTISFFQQIDKKTLDRLVSQRIVYLV